MRTTGFEDSERLRPGPDLPPRVSPPRETEPEWQLPASTAPPSLGQAEAGTKRKCEGTIRYKEGRERTAIQRLLALASLEYSYP